MPAQELGGRAGSFAPAGALAVHRVSTPAGSTKHVIVAKFRDSVPALEQPSSSLCLEARKLAAAKTKGPAPSASAAARRQESLSQFELSTPHRAYEGFKEMVGGSGSDASCYILLRVAELDQGPGPGAGAGARKLLIVDEVDDWIGLKPVILHETISIEDAEEETKKTLSGWKCTGMHSGVCSGMCIGVCSGVCSRMRNEIRYVIAYADPSTANLAGVLSGSAGRATR